MRNALDAMVLTDARLRPLADLARSELEAIERAAKDVVGSVQLRVWRKYEAADTLETIAREAP